MPLTSGDRLGPYEILAPLGSGGMGEVWKARDTRLDRIVAIKTVNGPFSERFEREARAISALNHPHICTLYDVGEHEGAGYLVMELVDGVPLAGPIPLERAVAYSVQICSALEAAHRKGIVHRDLKPANILVTKGGVKLLDFGLAKQRAGRVGEAGEAGRAGGAGGAGKVGGDKDQTDGAVTKALTGAHIILGTPQYMAPEQIEGKNADARTDIFAFGCVLYELLTGEKAFDGKTPSSVMAAILATEPRPMKDLQPLTPASIEHVVRRCLAKDPDDRWQTARDLRAGLEWIAEGREHSGESVARTGGKRFVLPWAVAAVFAVATGVALWAPWRAPAPEAEAVSFDIHPPNGFTFRAAPIVSPDGRRVALSVRDANAKGSLIIRRLDDVTVEPLAGTEGTVAVQAVGWSPDSRFVLFFADGRLKKIDANGGPAQTITTFQGPPFASWGVGGDLLLTGREGLERFSVSGEAGRLVTKLDPSRQEQQHYAPQFLPDGRHFLFFARSAKPENSAIFVGSLDGTPDAPSRTLLLPSQYMGLYARSSNGTDYLLYEADGNLMARPFDLRALTLTGEAVPIVQRIGVIGATTLGVSASAHGALAYSSGVGGQLVAKQFEWFDRSGKRLADIGTLGTYGDFTLSPDEKRIAVQRRVGDNWDIWFLDLERGGTFSRLKADPSQDRSPIWSPDGSRVLYTTNRDGYRIYEMDAGGAGAERLLSATQADIVTDIAPDGRSVVYESRFDLWALYEGKAIPVAQTSSREREGRFSPDGKWIAYISDESGQNEVYVQSFPNPGAKSLVSATGGTQPRWSRDGKELFYLSADGRLMSVSVRMVSGFQSSAPVVLFETQLLSSNIAGSYAVSRDGQRFLLQVPDPTVGAAAMTVLTNWLASARK